MNAIGFHFSLTFCELSLLKDFKARFFVRKQLYHIPGISARRNFFQGGRSEVHQGRPCKGGHRVGGSGGAEPPGRRRSSPKICKKAKKKITIFFKFQENFAIFSKIFWKFYRIFGENLDKNLDNLEIFICRGFGGGAPRRSRNYGNLSRKINGKLKFWIVLMENFAIFSKFLKNFIEFFVEIVPII